MKIGNFDSLFEDHLEDAKIIAIPHQRDEEEMEEEHTDAPLPEMLPLATPHPTQGRPSQTRSRRFAQRAYRRNLRQR